MHLGLKMSNCCYAEWSHYFNLGINRPEEFTIALILMLYSILESLRAVCDYSLLLYLVSFTQTGLLHRFVNVTYVNQRVGDADEVRHGCQKVVNQLMGQHWNEDVLPAHGVDDGVG